MKLPWLLSICLAVVLILFILFDKDAPSTDTEPFKQALHRANERIQELEINAVRISEKRVSDSLKTVATAEAHVREVYSYKTQITRLKSKPKVIEIIKANPGVDSLIQAQDSLIVKLEVRIDTLASELFTAQNNAFQAEENFKELVSERVTKDSLRNQLTEAAMKENKKLKRSVRWLKAGAVAATVGAFLLGAQL